MNMYGIRVLGAAKGTARFLIETREYILRIIPAYVLTSNLHNSLRDLEGLHDNLIVLEP